MQLGLTWPLQRLLKVSVPYGEPNFQEREQMT